MKLLKNMRTLCTFCWAGIVLVIMKDLLLDAYISKDEEQGDYIMKSRFETNKK